MEYSNIGTTLIITAIAGILTSLMFGLYQLLAGHQGTNLCRTLTFRVSMALMLLVGIILAVGFGWIAPNPIPL